MWKNGDKSQLIIITIKEEISTGLRQLKVDHVQVSCNKGIKHLPPTNGIPKGIVIPQIVYLQEDPFFICVDSAGMLLHKYTSLQCEK